MSDIFPTFEMFLKRCGRRTWRWRVCTTEGRLVTHGSETSRPAAKYAAARALFLTLLAAPYRPAGQASGLARSTSGTSASRRERSYRRP
ncbi:hypothetical protein F8237_23895 [Bradyrhizobium betae]|uniref:DUF1508 domain-containing protein n=1 Tax=Bradyrhizobium betae TaxID=244734 RepID=A0A5P6PA50_9BRAD|nr:hypothetical protein F8237_23895 [Bradyrhizobium betae]